MVKIKKKTISTTVKHKNLCDVLLLQGVAFMVCSATFNNISVMSWRSVLLAEETGIPWEKHRASASHWQTLSHKVVSSTHHLSRIRTHNVSGDRLIIAILTMTTSWRAEIKVLFLSFYLTWVWDEFSFVFIKWNPCIINITGL